MADNVEDRPVGRFARALDAVPALVWVALAAALLLGIVGLFGGLDTAQRHIDELPVLPIGEQHVGPQFSIAVHDATLMDVAPGYSFEADEGNEYLVVDVTLTNNWISSTISIQNAIALEWLDKEHIKVERTVLVSDNTTLPQAHPNMPIDVAIVWQVPQGSVKAGEPVRISVMEASLRTNSDLTFGQYWYDPTPVAYVDVVARQALPEGDSE